MKNILLLLMSFFFISCSRSDEDATRERNFDNHFISKSQVLTILNDKNFAHKFSAVSEQGKMVSKEISNLQTVTDNGEVVYYIANYQGGGFVIISADNRLDPILALSEENTFNYSSAKLKSGIGMWLNLQTEAVNYVRNNNIAQTDIVERAWDGLSSIAPEEPESGSSVTYLDAFTTTQWGQNDTYNDYTPIKSGCSHRSPTGCVPTAMAQIMKYNQYSSINNYNWSLMPDGSGTSETSRLMSDIGVAVNTSYGCGSSGTNEDYIKNGFSHFGYTNAQKTSTLIINWIINDLSINKPVILCGGSGSTRHAWVCDGYYHYREWGPEGGWSFQLFRMNWGFRGEYDAYFSLTNLNIDGNNLSSDLVLFYNLYHLPI